MDSLFSDSDLDQDMLEAENRRKLREIEKKRKEEDEEKRRRSEKKVYDKTLYVIDGYGLIYRSYYGIRGGEPVYDVSGVNINAYIGFFTTLFSLVRTYPMDYIAVAMDEKGPTFRHEMYPQYKATRDKAPDDLHAQVPMIVDALGKMGVTCISRIGYEADDVIASISRIAEKKGVRTIMFTGDKDLLQLVCDHVYALRPKKNPTASYELYTEKEVKDVFGVRPNQIVDYLALVGDSSDNVPGVAGIGAKTAEKLLDEFLTLDGIYRKIDSLSPGNRKKLEAGKENAYFSRKLVTLSFDALGDDYDLSSLDYSKLDMEKLRPEFAQRGLRRLMNLLGRSQDPSAPKPAMPASEAAKNLSATLPSRGLRDEEKVFRGKGSYELLTDRMAIERKFEECVEFHDGIIAFDTETTGLERDARLVGFSFSFEMKKAYYVPIVAGGRQYLPLDDAKALFNRYFTSGKLRVIGQNVKFDRQVLENLGEGIRTIYFDTMIASWLLDSASPQNSLDFLALKYLDYTTIRYEDIVSKGEDFSSVPVDTAVEYGAEDSDIAFRLCGLLGKRLVEDDLLEVYRKMENPLIDVLSSMERNGIYLSKERMDDLCKSTDSRLGKIVEEIYSEAGHEFNLNSTKQLGAVLFEERGLEPGKSGQTGYSTDVATLEGLRKSGDPLIPLILEYRTLSKLKGTYIDTLPLLRDGEGRIHTSFLQTGTATGRLSSKNPNLQNIPIRTEEGRRIRSCFIPKPGCVFISADYSQIELVVLAHMSGDENLRAAFIDGVDVHKATASLIFDKSVDEIDPTERRIAKTINFGIMYGMSAFRLSNELEISRSDASAFIKRYFERYAGVKSFVERTVAQAEKDTFVKTLFGHRRYIPGINSSNRNEKAGAERMAVNTVIQGTASEIMKRAMIALPSEFREMLLLQVHDELIFECPANKAAAAAAEIKRIMEETTRLDIPVRASVETGESWGDMH